MKIAVVCDWLVTYAGAERVLEAILQCYPQADLFAVIDFLPHYQRDFIQNKPVTTTFIQHFPRAKKWYRYYLPWMPLAIEQLNLSGYDLIISSSHAVAKGIIIGPHQTHISYVHSPIRYAWDLQHQYLKESGLERGLKGYVAKKLLHHIRNWDVHTAHRVDHFIANSQFIAKRIEKIYRRPSTVIYPPVNVEQFTPGSSKDSYYVTASRLVPYKRIDLIVEAFAAMPEKKLIVIGDGPEQRKIAKKAGKNVELLGYQPANVLLQTMQNAQAFVFAAEEDFGIAPLEAQACGTPVIAFGKGGALETVRSSTVDQPTGIFFPEQTVASLIAGIHQFEATKTAFTRENCVQQAAKFSAQVFKDKFTAYVNGIMEGRA